MLRSAKILLLLLGAGLNGFSTHVKDTIPLQNRLTLNIYLDCEDCDHDFIKTNFDLVNYVWDPGNADVYVLVSSYPTGSGGEKYNILLEGQHRFQSMTDTVTFSLPPDMTMEEERLALLNKLQLSLVHYIMKTPLGDRIQLVIKEDKQMRVQEKPEDPWRDWVFNISLLGSISGNKSYLGYNLLNSLYISKITSKIKFESSNQIKYEEDRFNLYENNTLIYSAKSLQRHFLSNNLLVRSLGEHGGIGGKASFLSSTYDNLDFQMRIGPAIEGNLYKYSQVSSKQLRLIYSLYYEHNKYTNKTIHDKMSDDLFQNEINLIFRHIGSWGHINASLNARSYLNNMSQYSVGAMAITSISLPKSLFLNMGMGLNLYRDQISLSQESISPDQFITSQREMETTYSYHFNLGISFRFGSRYNNTVNPRFGY